MELGQKIFVAQKYKSFRVFDKKKHAFIKRYKIIDIPAKEGYFVGYRNIKEGEFDWETNIVLKNIKVMLVAVDLRGLIYVPINCC